MFFRSPTSGTVAPLAQRYGATARVPGPTGTLRIDPATVFFTASGLLDRNGHAEVTWLVPNDLSLEGTTYYWQAEVGLPVKYTNLEKTTFTDL